jgi:flavodoxin
VGTADKNPITGVIMKSAVVYFSQSGQTRKVADAIAAALPGEVVIGAMKDQPSLDGCDIVFAGMPVVQFGAPQPVKDYLQAHCAGRPVALFVTHAAPEGMDGLDQWLANCSTAAAGAEIVGMFDCQGELAEPVRAAMAASDDPMLRQFAALGDVAVGQPDEARLTRAAEFAREMAARLVQ